MANNNDVLVIMIPIALCLLGILLLLEIRERLQSDSGGKILLLSIKPRNNDYWLFILFYAF